MGTAHGGTHKSFLPTQANARLKPIFKPLPTSKRRREKEVVFTGVNITSYGG